MSSRSGYVKDCDKCIDATYIFAGLEPWIFLIARPDANIFSRADGAVDEFANDVGVTVVACVFLNHVRIDPTQRAWVAATHTGVVEASVRGGEATCFVFLLPHRQVGLEIGGVERGEVSVIVVVGDPKIGGVGIA